MRYLLFLLLILNYACQDSQQATALDQQATTAFQLCQSAPMPEGLQLQAQLDTTAGLQMSLTLILTNGTGSTLAINPLEAALHTADQRRHLPIEVNAEASILAAGHTSTYRWTYQPINDLYLYQHSGLLGAWQQQYRLPLSFIGQPKDTLVFCFPDEAYGQYASQMEKKKPHLYKPSAASLSAQKVARQEAYWQQFFAHAADAVAGTANFSEQEFFMAGVNMRHALYHQGDSLYLQLQLVNHAPGQLQLRPKEMVITAGAREYRPQRIFSQQRLDKEEYLLKKGDRISLRLVYKAPAADSLMVSFAGLKAQQQPLFAEPFSFIAQ